MLKGHPKGLYVAFLANMGERFGFYTMMGILLLFLQAKFNLNAENAGLIYSTFYFLIYALALLGGFIADRTQNYKGVVAVGVTIMFLGYALLALLDMLGFGLVVACFALGIIALGNGLFKGNLQALVGQMYDNPQYSGLRDSAYSIFYMGINIGAMFAPNAAVWVQKWYLKQNDFPNFFTETYSLCKQFNPLGETSQLSEIASKVMGYPVTELSEFADSYLKAFSMGFHYAFGIAGVAMLISLASYLLFKQHLPEKKKAEAGSKDVPQMPKAEERQRLLALCLVFLVVIFFWMSFHQNGLTMTLFARDCTVTSVAPLSNLLFDIRSLLSIGLVAVGLVLALKPSSTVNTRLIGIAMAVIFGAVVYYFYNSFALEASHQIHPTTFQHFNAFFVVFLTPVIVGLFAWLRSKGKEPSAPRKIGIGMIIAALGFVVLLAGSLGMPVAPVDAAGHQIPLQDTMLVSTQWLIQSYLVLTIAELFLSPMGMSFVSKVAPPRFQGLMQGGWLCATAIGNQLLFVGTFFWSRLPVWGVWSIFIVCCLISAVVIFSLMKRLELVAK